MKNLSSSIPPVPFRVLPLGIGRRLLLLSLGCLFFVSGYAQSNKGAIIGTVTDAAGKPMSFVNISLEGTTLGTTTSADGSFALRLVSPGTYSLIASGVGLENESREVEVMAGISTQVSLQVQEKLTSLQEVEITGRKETTYQSDISFVGTKTGTNIKEIPQSIAVITKEVMQDQQVYRISDAVKNVSGINQFSSYNDITMRGFRSDANFINGLRAGFSFWTVPVTPHYERIEVLKGPSSVLFGNATPGGIVNVVTKKPLDETRQSVSFTTGSFDTYRATADLTGPMNEEKTVLYRLNIGYENANTFRDFIRNENLIIAPSVSFIPTEKTRINMELVYGGASTKLDRGVPVIGQNVDLLPIGFNVNQPSDYLREKNLSLTASLNHKFNEVFSFNSAYMKFRYEEDLFEHRTSNVFRDSPLNTIMIMQVLDRNTYSYTDFITNYLIAKFNTGGIRHEALLGLDYNKFRTESSQATARNTTKNTMEFEADNVPDFNLLAPTYTYQPAINSYNFNRGQVSRSTNDFVGIYLQDQVKLGDRLKLLLSGRYDVYNNPELGENKRFTSLLPRIGAVYSLTSELNAYASYTKGFEPQLVNSQIAGGPFDPMLSSQYEAGLKGGYLGNRLVPSLAVYQIRRENMLVADPENVDRQIQGRAEQSRGVEFDLAGSILTNFSVIANYAYNETIIQQDPVDETLAGRVSENAPKHMGGLWAKYTFNNRLLDGIGIAFGTNFVSERRTFEEGLNLDAYQILDAALYYTVKKFSIALNVNNLVNTKHFVGGYNSGRIFPGAPRNFLTKVAYAF